MKVRFSFGSLHLELEGQDHVFGLGCLFSIQTLVYSKKTTNPAAGPNSLDTCCLATGWLVGMDSLLL